MSEAVIESPDNPFVKLLLKNGVLVNELYENTPKDIRTFRKLKANQFHDGCGLTHVEILDSVPDVKASWDSHRKEKNIKSTNCPTRCSYLLTPVTLFPNLFFFLLGVFCGLCCFRFAVFF